MQRIHVANAKGRDATVAATTTPPEPGPRPGKAGQPVTFRRLVAAGAGTLHEDLLDRFGGDYADQLVDADPEVDVEMVGRFIDATQTVLLDSHGQPLYCAPQVVEVTYAPTGEETARRAPVETAATVNDTDPVKWTGRRMAKKDMVRRFAVRRTLQLQHVDGVTYDFLHGMASDLAGEDAVVLLGSGPDGKGPLVLQHNGVPYRGFLEGRVDGDRYLLLLHLSNMELKRPADPDRVGADRRRRVVTGMDRAVLSRLQAYRSGIASRYQPVLPDEITARIAGQVVVSAKVDGELWFLLQVDGAWTLAAPNGRVLPPDIPLLATGAAAALDPAAIVAGELYAPGSDGDRERVGGVTAALGAGDTSRLAFAAFDVVSAPGIDAVATPYSQRLAALDALPDQGLLTRIQAQACDGGADVAAVYHEVVVDGGREGLVVRADDGRAFKVKPVLDIDAVILGFTERRGPDDQPEVNTILIGLAHPDGGWVPLATVGNLGTSDARRALLARLVGDVTPSGYRRTSDGSGLTYRFVAPRVVAEVRCSDVQGEDTKGHRIRDPRLTFGPDTGWTVAGWTESASLLHLVLTRVRDDKAPTADDCGWQQITRLLPAPTSNSAATVQPSRVLRRQVWTKTTGDRTDVRKLLVWATGKTDAGYPAYVVHWTDYNPTRKNPLTREVRAAPTEDQAHRLADQMISDHIKKGWTPASSD